MTEQTDIPTPQAVSTDQPAVQQTEPAAVSDAVCPLEQGADTPPSSLDDQPSVPEQSATDENVTAQQQGDTTTDDRDYQPEPETGDHPSDPDAPPTPDPVQCATDEEFDGFHQAELLASGTASAAAGEAAAQQAPVDAVDDPVAPETGDQVATDGTDPRLDRVPELEQQLREQKQAYTTQIEHLKQQLAEVASERDSLRQERDALQQQVTALGGEVQRLRQELDDRTIQRKLFQTYFIELSDTIQQLRNTWEGYVSDRHVLNTPYRHLIDTWNQAVAASKRNDEAEVAVQIHHLGDAFKDVVAEWKRLRSYERLGRIEDPFNTAYDTWKEAYDNLPSNQGVRNATGNQIQQQLTDLKKRYVQLDADKRRFQGEVDALRAQNQRLAEENRNINGYNMQWQDRYRQLQREISEYRTREQANRHRLAQIDQLEQQVQRASALEAELKATRQQLAQAEEDRRRVLGELGQKHTNFDNTSVSGSRPQHEELVRRFRQLRDDGIEPAVRAIFKYLSQQDPGLKSPSQRREMLARIKSAIAIRILVEVEVEKNGDASHPSEETSEERSHRLQEATIGQICAALELPPQSPALDEIRQLLAPLVAEGLDLLERIDAAQPRGDIWIEKQGVPFNAQIHETVPGSSESGPVSFTIFPGYNVENRTLVPAVVWTTHI